MLTCAASATDNGCDMDLVGILREFRILATQLQTDRFYALYLLLAVLVFTYLVTTS